MADIEFGGRYGRLYKVLDWLLRLVTLNLLWVLGVLAGLVVAGLAPATSALYAMLREYLLGRSPRLWRDFWAHWRSALPTSQVLLGVPLLTIWVLVFYTVTARGTPFVFGLVALSLGYLAALLQLPAAVAHLELPVTETWRATIAIAWRRPAETVGVVLLTVMLLVGAWYALPAAVPLFFPALPALLATLAFRRGVEGVSDTIRT